TISGAEQGFHWSVGEPSKGGTKESRTTKWKDGNDDGMTSHEKNLASGGKGHQRALQHRRDSSMNQRAQTIMNLADHLHETVINASRFPHCQLLPSEMLTQLTGGLETNSSLKLQYL
ncbi:uncharacterized protein CCOS01_01018, partial [Colletotrichum costaricense]